MTDKPKIFDVLKGLAPIPKTAMDRFDDGFGDKKYDLMIYGDDAEKILAYVEKLESTQTPPDMELAPKGMVEAVSVKALPQWRFISTKV